MSRLLLEQAARHPSPRIIRTFGTVPQEYMDAQETTPPPSRSVPSRWMFLVSSVAFVCLAALIHDLRVTSILFTAYMGFNAYVARARGLSVIVQALFAFAALVSLADIIFLGVPNLK